MSAIRPALADLARGDLASLHALLSGLTRGTSRAAQLDARHDTEKQDTLLTWAPRPRWGHGQADRDLERTAARRIWSCG